MSGHSKFANIKHKKEKNDAAKGKIFTMIGREIAVAVKEGGPDPANNFKLAQVIAKAKANNMPNDTIDRGIKKAAGDGNNVNYETATYEGYGPSGTAIIVKCLTDNKNRTAANVRNALEKKELESIEATKKLIAQRKELERRKKAEESKKRTHRLCQIGGAVESVLGCPIEEEDLPKMVGFLKRQETNGKFFSKAMQKEPFTDMEEV